MRTRNVILSVATLLALAGVSSEGEPRHLRATRTRNPIIIESQIREIRIDPTDDDHVVILLYRQPYEVVAVKWLPVETLDGSQLYARDLQERDNIRLEGDLDHKTVYANRIVLQRREQHVGR